MSYWKLSEEAMNKRLSNILLLRKEMMGNVDKLHVSISTGNSKLGAIPSVSLIPVLDCANCSACGHSCYDLRHDLIYKAGRIARVTNNLIYTCAPQRYFREIKAWLTLNFPRAFRWHIGGGIKDVFYYHQMIHIAETFPDIKFLCFTKRFNLVNQEYAKGNIAPDNLRIIFSGWKGQKMPNPYGFPSAHPLFSDGTTSAHDGAKLCTNNCTECLHEKRLCWTLGNNEEVIFPAH